MMTRKTSQAARPPEGNRPLLGWVSMRSCSLLVLIGIQVTGCGKLGPPEPIESSRVVGRVHVKTAPVTGGWIEFLPTDGARGHLRSAPIGPDGRFEMTRVARGVNAIRLVRPKGRIPLGRAFESYHSSQLRRTIGPGAEASIDIDLATEAARRSPEKSPIP